MSAWDFCIKRPVFTTVIIATFIIVGLMGYTRMGVDLMPDFDVPVVSITTTYVGADPEVMDQDVVDVIEEQVGTIEGIDSITSTSYDSYSTIVVEFDLDRDIDVAAQEVRDKVSAANQDLPDDIDPPLVQKIDPDAQAIMYLTVYGDVPYQVLADVADNTLKNRIQSLKGVGKVSCYGFRDRCVRIWLDPEGMEKYDVGPSEVVSAINKWHVELPGGRVENSAHESAVKMKGEFATVDELKNLAVFWRKGAPVRLKDIAVIEDGSEDERGMARYNGVRCITLAITKQTGTNTVGVAQLVKDHIPDYQRVLPPGVKVALMFDSSDFIRNSVEGVGFDLLLGGALTAIVIYLFLRHIKMTLISLVSIPTSLLGAFGFMYFMGFTVNQITMLAMSLSVGLVIDDTIVVLENIFRHLEEGARNSKVAASYGAGEVAFAVLAATASIAAIFLPVAFMGGMVGRVFYQFGISVGIAITLSYIISVSVTPMLCGRYLRKEHHDNFFVRMVGDFLAWLDRTYKFLLDLSLRNRFTRVMVIIIAFAAFAGGLYIAKFVGTEFSPNSDRSAFLVSCETPIGSSIYLTDARVKEVESVVRKLPELKRVLAWTGSQANEANKATIIVDLVPRNDRTRTQQQIMDSLRLDLAKIPGITCYPAHIPQMGGSGARATDLSYVLQGTELNELQEVAAKLEQVMIDDPDYRDVDDDLELTRPEVSIYPDRDSTADVNLDTRSIAIALQAMMGGTDVAKFKINGKRYDIRVKAKDDFRENSDSIKKIVMRTPSGERVEMGAIANVVEGLGPNTIKRYDRLRSVTITANLVAGVASGDAGTKFENKARKILESYPNCKLVPSGMTKVQQESMGYMMFALFSAIFIIYMVLAAQFESFIHPLTIMMTLPLSIVGVFAALYLTGNTFNIFSIIGLIMLVGILTRNGILLVEFANQQREFGATPYEAMMAAGPVRLRPILMTAVSSGGGVIPIALGMSEGGEARAGMGVAVIGGLTTSTLLTLFVVPVAYITFDGIMRNMGKLWTKIFGESDIPDDNYGPEFGDVPPSLRRIDNGTEQPQSAERGQNEASVSSGKENNNEAQH